MSSLRELAIAKLHAKAGHGPGHLARQEVSRAPECVPARWDGKNGGLLPNLAGCPAVPPPKSLDSGTGVPNPGHLAGRQAGQAGILDDRIAELKLREWFARLSALDVYEPPEDFDQRRWGMLLDDACWLYSTHASRLVRHGWSAMDLFAVIPSQRGWGGLADRIRGARNVLFDDRGQAHWTRLGVKFSASPGIGEALRGSDAQLLWELASQ